MCVRVFSVGFGPGLDSMSPARSRRSASHVAGTHGWLPQKTGRSGLRRGVVGGYNLHSVPPNSPPDCGTPTTSRLYPFGAYRLHYTSHPQSSHSSTCLFPYLFLEGEESFSWICTTLPGVLVSGVSSIRSLQSPPAFWNSATQINRK